MAMVAMMVAWAERRAPAPTAAAIADPPRKSAPECEKPREIEVPQRTRTPKEITPIQPANVVAIQRAAVFGSIRKFAEACLTPAAGDRLELQAVFVRYQGWCKEGCLAPAPLEKFLDEIEAVCRKADIEIAPEGDKVYCLGVRLAA
jgi:hypothetical protein